MSHLWAHWEQIGNPSQYLFWKINKAQNYSSSSSNQYLILCAESTTRAYADSKNHYIYSYLALCSSIYVICPSIRLLCPNPTYWVTVSAR